MSKQTGIVTAGGGKTTVDDKKRVNFVEESTGVKVDDPTVQRALEAYDHLDDIERRDYYRSAIQTMVAYRRTGEEQHFIALTRMYEQMILVDTIPGLLEKIRAQRDAPPPAPGDVMSTEQVERLIARLRGEDQPST